MSGLAATLRTAEPGTRLRLLLNDGSEVTGDLRAVNGETVDVGDKQVELRTVKRLGMQFGASRESRAAA